MGHIFKKSDFDFFISLVTEAGEAAHKIQNGTIEITRKSDRSIVTQADLMVQDLLIKRISARYRDMSFIHEENNRFKSGDINADSISAIIDPIDGTAVFSMRLPLWCVSVGIFKGFEPLYGFVYSPGCGMFFYNDNDQAYLNGRPTRVEKNMQMDNETNIFFASEAHNLFTFDFPGKVRNLGSTALHACLTIDNARNRTLAFIGKSRLWDWAGAVPILYKAGVNIRYVTGEEMLFEDVFRNDLGLLHYAIAYNSDNFEMVRGIFKKK